jgi:uncharacterized YigZ family protein
VELVERRSRFIATLARVAAVGDARAFVGEMRDEMPDATHHAYAFRIGHGATETCGLSDDGEPSGTAGRPVLAALRASGMGDACVVVTRYFGGTKLGTGGLVRAYGAAARQVLAEAPVVTRVDTTRVRVRASYADYDAVVRVLQARDATVLATEFAQDVVLDVAVPTSRLGELETSLGESTAGRARLDVHGAAK